MLFALLSFSVIETFTGHQRKATSPRTRLAFDIGQQLNNLKYSPFYVLFVHIGRNEDEVSLGVAVSYNDAMSLFRHTEAKTKSEGI